MLLRVEDDGSRGADGYLITSSDKHRNGGKQEDWGNRSANTNTPDQDCMIIRAV